MTTTAEDLRNWAREACMVVHVPTGMIGVANKFYDGEVEKFKDANGVMVEGPVLIIDQHSFVAKEPTRFFKLPEHAAEFLVEFAESVGALVKQSAASARGRGVDPETYIRVITSVLREQVRNLNPSRSVPR